MVEMTGAKALIQALEKEAVDVVFGLPGGANLPIYDALVGANLRHILVRHEQSAAHMADGYARIKRKAGVCFATSGPGATNIITGIATAYADSSPIVTVTGQVPLAMIGKDAFQETDIIGIANPCTKYSFQPRAACQKGVLYRRERETRPSARGHSKGRAAGHSRDEVPRPHQGEGLQSHS